jgi:hypothetical protein
MRTLLILGLAACSGAGTASTAAPKHPAEAPLVLELLRRPVAGTHWHSVESYDTETVENGASRGKRHMLLETDVVVREQVADHEALEVEVIRHEVAINDRPVPGVQAPHAKLTVLRGKGSCTVTRDGTQLTAEEMSALTTVFDCNLPAEGEQDDNALYNTRTPHRIGERWAMNQDMLKSMLGRFDAAEVVKADATVERVPAVDGIEGVSLDSGFELKLSNGATTIEAVATTKTFLPDDPRLPILRHEHVMETKAGAATGIYKTSRTRTLVR